MGFSAAVRSGFRNYVTFSGRASRSEVWYWFLFYFLVLLAGYIIDAVIGLFLVSVIASLVLIVPFISVEVRRLHDRDRSGWWWLIHFVPLVGAVVMFVWLLVLAGTPGDNRFGPNPLARSVPPNGGETGQGN